MKMNENIITITMDKEAVTVFINYRFVDEYEPMNSKRYKAFTEAHYQWVHGFGYCPLRKISAKEAFRIAYGEARRNVKKKLMAVITK